MRHLRFVAMVLCAILLASWPASAQRTIRCTSNRFGYRYCRADTDNRVRLTRQRSVVRCRLGHNWGFDRRGVWVDRGCDADFEVGRGGGGNAATVAAGAAVAGVAVAALIASHRNKEQSKTASWAVGTFSGYDDRESVDVELTILPGGSVKGSAGNQDFTGTLDRDELEAGRYTFRVEKSGNGFVATDRNDSTHRVVFRRSGTGYGSGSGY